MSGKITIVSKPPKLERKKRVSRYRSLLYSKSLLMSWVRMILLTSGFATEFSIFASAMIIP